MQPEIESPLTIYVDYKRLPADQAGTMLISLHNLYQLVSSGSARGLVRHTQSPLRRIVPRISENESVLCLESVDTGNSITFQFSGQRKPTGIRWDGNELELVLPRWSAAAVAVGALLLGSLHVYDKWLEVQLKSLEVQRAEEAFERESKDLLRIREQTKEVLRILREPEASDYYPPYKMEYRFVQSVSDNINAFHSVITEENINRVSVNGEPIE